MYIGSQNFKIKASYELDHQLIIFPFSGMSESGLSPDGTIYPDRRPGRRGRRHRSSTKSIEEKSGSSFPSGKESAGARTLEGSSHDNTREGGKFTPSNAWV